MTANESTNTSLDPANVAIGSAGTILTGGSSGSVTGQVVVPSGTTAVPPTENYTPIPAGQGHNSRPVETVLTPDGPVRLVPQSDAEVALDAARVDNARLRLELENSHLRFEAYKLNQAMAVGQMPSFPSDGVTHPSLTPQPKTSGGAPVPLPPRVPVQSGPPKQGDVVNVACRSGAVIRATGQRCDGRKAKIQAKMGSQGMGLNGAGGRRVIYVCQKCNQRQTFVLQDEWVLVCSGCGHERTLKNGLLIR